MLVSKLLTCRSQLGRMSAFFKKVVEHSSRIFPNIMEGPLTFLGTELQGKFHKNTFPALNMALL